MFKKLVSNLPFSPALVGQIGFYARRLKKEEATRRLGLIFTALALVVQSFAVFSPPEPANAAGGGDCSDNAIIRCGAMNIDELRQKYNQNATGDLQTIFAHYGLTWDIINHGIVKPGVTYRDGRVVTDNVTVGVNSSSLGRQNARGEQYAVWIGGQKYYSTPNDKIFLSNSISVLSFFDHNNGRYVASIMLDCGNPISSTVIWEPAPTPTPTAPTPTPTASCDSIEIVKINRTQFKLTGKASAANGAVVDHINYDLKDGSGKVIKTVVGGPGAQSTVTMDVTTPGSYTIQAVPLTSLGWIWTPNCEKPITVDAAPAAECSSLKVIGVSRTQFRLVGSATASNGANIKYITYRIKDSSGKVVFTKQGANGASSEVVADLVNDGKYTAEATAVTSVGDKTSEGCTKPLTVSPKPMCAIRPDLPADSPDCKPCEGDPELWYKDEDCSSSIEMVKKAINVTQGGVDATTVTAKAGDIIQYSLTVKNTGLVTEKQLITDRVNDITDYATMRDTGGGDYKNDAVTYGEIDVKPKTEVVRTFSVQVVGNIPSTPRGAVISSSNDCKMSNNYGNTITINVDCPPVKIVEQVTELPATGPRENMIFAGTLLAVVTFFYARSRQLGKEVKLVRKSFNASAI